MKPVHVLGLGVPLVCPTADASTAVVEALKKIEPSLRRAARRLTVDYDTAEDLLQEARIRLWELDPTRFDLGRDDDLRYVCRALITAMWKGCRSAMAGTHRPSSLP